ncbi:hypothetical protein PC118_g10882 [Phytophthora cactorum]|uniref:PiggyBac transposable element-derived protein domain-containing protein n=1 Tax=Phytophthora cactorum TaxID=29920 RepID=A0A8T1FSJ7_9STRA|nr:hypothetical protein PC118_g10882 [Phytophthora cactorum]
MFIEPEESAVPEESVEPESVTASQIVKTVALSAKTVEDLFGPESEESEDDGERTQHIEGPNPENEHGTTCVAAAGDSASPSNSGQSDAAAEPATPLIPDVNDVLLPLHLNTEDVNVMKDGENADDYESFGSEADGSGSSDDERIERRQTGDEVLAGEEEMSLMDTAFIDCLDGSLSIEDMDQNTLHSMAWSPVSSEFEPDAHAFPGMSDQVARPSADIRANKDSPVELLFYFMPTYPWRHITRETNRYKKVHVDEKARQEHARLTREIRLKPGQTLRDFLRRLRVEPDYVPRELLCVMGLLAAHMLNPTRVFSDHWAMTDDGALSAGSFGHFIPRNRCTAILRDVHFCNNDTANKRDKWWKLRAVVDVLQERCLAAWTVSNVTSFDEGVLPATSNRNNTRMFMPDKPHRYSTKMFMTCDAVSAYCHSTVTYDFRFEIYIGKRQVDETASEAFDHKTRAAAGIRNLKAVLDEHGSGFRIIVVDRF